jgi:S-formylglutathione hydrolase FrmB
LLVFLHGRSEGSPDVQPSSALYDALDAVGDDAPVVVFPNGDGDSYWHDRSTGDWASWVMKDIIPTVALEHGIDPGKVAIGGISMGGFGAFDLARLNPGRFCAVGGHSPALWQTGGETAPGAFDDAADFERHDVIGAARADPDVFADTPLWIDGGRADPFQPGIQAFADALTAAGVPVSVHTPPGGHQGSYWDAHWDQYMRFYSRELARC